MKKNTFVTIISITLALSSHSVAIAQEVPCINSGLLKRPARQIGYISKYTPLLPVLSEDSVKLNPKEQKGIDLAEQWKNRSDMPFLGEDGSIQFVYGTTLPSVVCAPLYASDIALQPGESVRQILVGDASRWKISPGTSGSNENAVTHLVIKPSDVGLSTNLVVHTDRRSYNILLVSKKDQWMPLISFSYPEDTQTQWAAYSEQHQQLLKAKAVYSTALSTSTGLNFNYQIKGDSPLWKPVRVYSDKAKTYIQFPANVKYAQAPALVILDRTNQEQLVNYRMVDDRYVIDQVIEKAALIRGIGHHQERVEISRGGA